MALAKLEPILTPAEPAAPNHLRIALDAEIRQLCARTGGTSEIEEIYRIWPGPNSRRRAVQKLSAKRIADRLKFGAVELTVICYPRRVDLELAWAKRLDELPDAPAVQGEIVLTMFPDPDEVG